MKTFPLTDAHGTLYAFEIGNDFFSSASMARFVRRVPGCEVTHVRRLFSDDEVHVRFRFNGVALMIWEPFGDNSRLWVGPDDGETVPTETVHSLLEGFASLR